MNRDLAATTEQYRSWDSHAFWVRREREQKRLAAEYLALIPKLGRGAALLAETFADEAIVAAHHVARTAGGGAA